MGGQVYRGVAGGVVLRHLLDLQVHADDCHGGVEDEVVHRGLGRGEGNHVLGDVEEDLGVLDHGQGTLDGVEVRRDGEDHEEDRDEGEVEEDNGRLAMVGVQSVASCVDHLDVYHYRALVDHVCGCPLVRHGRASWAISCVAVWGAYVPLHKILHRH